MEGNVSMDFPVIIIPESQRIFFILLDWKDFYKIYTIYVLNVLIVKA